MKKQLPLKEQRKRFVIGGLRRLSYKWPYRGEAMNAAKVAYGTYTCAMCKFERRRKDVQLDHVEPVVDPSTGFTSFSAYITRLLPGKGGWQVLCVECHAQKTKEENEARRK